MAGFRQMLEVHGKRRRLVVVDPRFAHASASGILRGHHGVSFVVVYSGVEPDAAEFSTRAALSRLSCYLTPSEFLCRIDLLGAVRTSQIQHFTVFSIKLSIP